MNEAASRVLKSRLAGAIVAVGLAIVLYARASDAYPFQVGIDFYQFWGVPVANKMLGSSRTPYVDPAGYADVLNGLSDASGSEKLHQANHHRRSLEPMGTPLLYATFQLAPADYDRAHLAHTLLLFAAAGAVVFLLATLKGAPVPAAICVALAVLIVFNPFVQDVKYGNVTSLQLLFVVALLWFAIGKHYPRNAALEGLLVGSLAAFVIFKPNTLWIALGLGIHFALARGASRTLAHAAGAGVFTALALAVAALYFHDAGVWAQWLRFAQNSSGDLSLVRSLEQGNQSLAMLLTQRSQTYTLLQYSALITAALALVFLSAMSSMGKRTDLVGATARRCFADPWFAASAGIVFIFATSPLVWAYYHLFALVPIFWLFRREGGTALETSCALVSFAAMANPLLEFLGAHGFFGPLYSLLLLGWLPLLLGTLAYVVQQQRCAAVAASSPAVA